MIIMENQMHSLIQKRANLNLLLKLQSLIVRTKELSKLNSPWSSPSKFPAS